LIQLTTGITLGSITTKQGFGAIFGMLSTKCFKFYLYLPITHFVLLAKDGLLDKKVGWKKT
jgi:hypothetical protein